MATDSYKEGPPPEQMQATVRDAVPAEAGTENLMPLGVAVEATHLALSSVKDGKQGKSATSGPYSINA